MAENILFRYSDFFQDDGGFERLKSEFTKTGEELIAESKRIKSELAKNFSFDNLAEFQKLESQTQKLESATRKYTDAKKAMDIIDSAHTKALKDEAAAEIALERAKQAKLSTVKKEIDAEIALSKGIKAGTDAQRAQLSLEQQQAKARNTGTEATNRQRGAYAQLSADLRGLFRDASDVAAQMFLLEKAGLQASDEYKSLEVIFENLKGRTNELDGVLKKIDGTLGRSFRNVGNYASGFSGMNNAVQQIVREAPSAAVSMNTFFLAISNNLPILFDQISAVRTEMAKLKDNAKESAAVQADLARSQKEAAEAALLAQMGYKDAANTAVSGRTATKQQIAAIREQIAAQQSEIASNGSAAASTVAKTEAMLVEIGVTIEQIAVLRQRLAVEESAAIATIQQTAALEAQAAATAAANAEMSKAPTVLAQITKSLFSVNTALIAGVTILTLFGGKFIEWLSTLGQAKLVLEEVAKAQEKLNSATAKARAESRGNIEDMKLLLSLATNQLANDASRNEAVKQLRNNFTHFFESFTDGEIKVGKANTAVKALTESLQAQARVSNLTNAKKESEQRIEDIKQEMAIREQFAKKEEEIAQRRIATTRFDPELHRNETTFTLSPADRAEIDALRAKEKARKKALEDKKDDLLLDGTNKDLVDSIDRLEKSIDLTQNRINANKEKAILLDIKAEKDAKSKLDNQIKSVDFEASRYELRKTILENSIRINEEIFASDKYTLEQRIAAQKQMVVDMTALAELNRDEQLRVLKNTYDKERTETIKDSDGKIIALKYTQKALLELEKQYNFDVAKVREDFREQQRQIDEKARGATTLDALNMQLANLKYLRDNLSATAADFESYASKIKSIQDKIDAILNQQKTLELSDKININDEELKRLEEFQQRMKDTFGNFTSLNQLNNKQRKQYIAYLKAFEKEKTDIEGDAEKQRELARLEAIRVEQSTATSGIQWKQLELEKQAILKKLKEEEIKRTLDGNKTMLDSIKDFTADWKQLLDQVLDKIIEVQQKNIQANENAVQKQNDAVTRQEERARAGMDNTLAYEQQQLAKREADLARSQKRLERLEKVKSLYASYSNYSSKGDDNALAKAFRDFAILEAFAASLGDGGAIDDVLASKSRASAGKVPTDGRGIIRGRSHRGQRGGIPVLVEGREGILSAREMRNLGKGNFYKIKERAAMGPVGSNFISRQRQQFAVDSPVPMFRDDYAITNGLADVKRAIQDKPTQTWDKAEVVGDVIKIVETIVKPGGNVKNTYIIKKPRL